MVSWVQTLLGPDIFARGLAGGVVGVACRLTLSRGVPGLVILVASPIPSRQAHPTIFQSSSLQNLLSRNAVCCGQLLVVGAARAHFCYSNMLIQSLRCL